MPIAQFYRVLILLFLIPVEVVVAQFGPGHPTQTIRGNVRDAETERPLAGTNLILEDATQAYNITADENGTFRMTKVPVGRYHLTASYVGYETVTIAELLVESGKEQIVEVRMRVGAETLTETVVKGNRPDNTLTSVQQLSTEQILRFPATYLDPARLVTSFPGVVNTNDQANNISVRGNSPNGFIWRLEGVEIVNPNHLSNAGTIGDRPTASGGGVNILSAQLLGSTRFLSGAFSPEYGNTLAGVMDMRFRTGNNEKHEFTAQAGLIGLDLASEGPLSKKKGSSYLINYRYSFTGLLGLMGISFGGEDIRFQDLSVNLTQPLKKGGKLTFFTMAGTGSNNFKAPEDPAERLEDKDRYNIYFSSRMLATGGTYSQPIGERLLVKVSAVASTNTNNRFQSPASGVSFAFPAYVRDRSTNGRATIHASMTYRPTNQRRWQAGLYLTRWYGSIGLWKSTTTFTPPPRPGRIQEGVMWSWLLQPYINYQWTPNEKLMFNAGLHGNVFTYNSKSMSIEPRLSVRYQLNAVNTVTFAYGLHSQTQQPVLYLAQNLNPFSSTQFKNSELGLSKAHHLVGGYTYNLNELTSLKAEAYYQSLVEVPVSKVPGSVLSALNVLDITEFAEKPEPMVNEGRGRNMGLELTLQRFLGKGYFMVLTGSLYDSKFQALDGVWRDTRFNGRHTINLTGGKEFSRLRFGSTRTWGVNGKIAQLGGFLDRPINVAASKQAGTTVYTGNDFSIKLPDYFRADVRVYWRKSRPKYSRMLSLDLMNVTNAHNAAYSYFDPLKGEVVRKNQLGLLPMLNYRWEF